MSWRAVLVGGPLDGITLNLDHLGPPPADWPTRIGNSEVEDDGAYVLDKTEPVPFAMGAHPNLLLTGHYRWEARP